MTPYYWPGGDAIRSGGAGIFSAVRVLRPFAGQEALLPLFHSSQVVFVGGKSNRLSYNRSSLTSHQPSSRRSAPPRRCMNGNKAPAGRRYFCRGCGDPLPGDWHGQFHPECLKADKRRRTQDKRRLERARHQQWLQRQHCPECGAMLSRTPAPPAGTADRPGC
jgi:hypothetical protein